MPRYVVGNDISKQPPTERYAIDFFGMSEQQAQVEFPEGMQILINRVKPFRAQNRRETRSRNWWLFGENAPKLRRATAGLFRYIATSEVAKNRAFVFLPMPGTLADGSLAAIANEDSYILGVLSSKAHLLWALARGGTLEDRPRYQNGPCFETFAFPVASAENTRLVRELGEQLDAHRKRQQAAHPALTITGMYNVLEKLRSGEALTAKEKVIHEEGLVSVLKQLHDELDAAVFDAYGWPRDLSDEQLLEKLVALNAERAEEEKSGLVRWLRPEFQNPGGAQAATQVALAGVPEDAAGDESVATVLATQLAWPKGMPEQLGAVRDLVLRGASAWTAKQTAARFKGVSAKGVVTVLDSLAALGLVVTYEQGGERAWRAARAG
jgi:hypothetical protein